MKPRLLKTFIVSMADNDPDLSHLTDGDPAYAEEDRQRLESHGVTWASIGIRAEAEIVVECVIQRITSGGLWGVEDDSADGYLTEVAKEEFSELTEILSALGVEGSPVFESAEKVTR
jgi:hypothetical protein